MLILFVLINFEKKYKTSAAQELKSGPQGPYQSTLKLSLFKTVEKSI